MDDLKAKRGWGVQWLRNHLVMLFAAILVWSASTSAQAEKRVALVIGNANYVEFGALDNPLNDARAIAVSLGRLGFETMLALDLTIAETQRKIREFATFADGADMALFFYAGHGIQVDGVNYLLPVDAQIEHEVDLKFSAVDLQVIYQVLNNAAKTRLIVLDACRDNPFTASLARSMGRARTIKSLGRGLAPTKASGGSLIAFATAPGNIAYDGDGQHSPYTAALLNHLETPDLEINVLLTRVRAEVVKKTSARQRPWSSSDLLGEVYLSRKPKETIAAPTPTNSLDLALWRAAEKTGSPAAYQAYLDKFPDGTFAGIARLRLAATRPNTPKKAERDPNRVPRTPDRLDLPKAGENETNLTTQVKPPILNTEARDRPDRVTPPAIILDPKLSDEDSIALIRPVERPKPGNEAGLDASGMAHADPTNFDHPTPPRDEPVTKALLPKISSRERVSSTAETEAALELDRQSRREIQQRLSLLKYNTRGIDGIFGKGTRAAIRAWQKKKKYPETGFLDAKQLASLRSATDELLAAYQSKQATKRKEAERRRKERIRSERTTNTRTRSERRGLYTAVSRCGGASGRGRHQNRQRAMTTAMRICAARGGSPSCCASNISVSR